MQNVILFCLAALAIAIAGTRFAERYTGAPAVAAGPSVAGQRAPEEPVSSANHGTVSIARDRNGHFRVNGAVDGRHMGFLVDTGASVVSLTESDARRVGIFPAERDYTAEVRTANGTIRAARTQLRMIEVGGIMLRDVPALVLPDAALNENLLGLSFLSRLRRFEYNSGRLVLEQ